MVPFAVCNSVTPSPNGSLRKWKVVCQFNLDGADPQQPQPDDVSPVDLRPRVEPYVEAGEVVIYKDFTGKYIVDPFKKLWDQPVKAPIPLSGVRVTKYVQGYNENTLAYWLHTTNLNTWRGKDEDAWAVKSVVGKEVEVGKFKLAQLQFEILSNPTQLTVQIGDADPAMHFVGWMELRAARSIKYLNSSEQIEVNRIARNGEPEPVWVDKDGHKSDVPYFFAYRTRPQRNFNDIVKAS